MGKFVEVMKIAFKQLFHYKWTFAMSIFTQPILLILNLILFKSIYAFNGASEIKGYGLEQMVWYFQSYMVVMAFVWNNIANGISRDIITGDLAMHLLRPYPFFRFSLAISTASRVVAQIMDFLPGMVIYSLILFPSFLTPISFLKFLPVVLLASMINFLYAFNLGMTAMVIKNNSSIILINDLFIYVAGGALIPIEFYPDWLNRILDFLPFKYIVYWPIQFFLNRDNTTQPEAWLRIIMIELCWIIVLYLGYRLLWRTFTKKFCAAGG